MTREEFSTIVKGMKSIYCDPKFIPDQFSFDMWYALLGDLTYEQCSKSVQAYMMQEKFPPTPSDIRSKLAKNETNKEPNGNETWAMVYKALCNSTYNAESEFEKLPEIVQKAVGSPGALRSLASSSDFNEEVEKSHFIRIYDATIRRQTEEYKLSPKLRETLGTNNNLQIGENNGINN